jgi:hypothetical protein
MVQDIYCSLERGKGALLLCFLQFAVQSASSLARYSQRGVRRRYYFASDDVDVEMNCIDTSQDQSIIFSTTDQRTRVYAHKRVSVVLQTEPLVSFISSKHHMLTFLTFAPVETICFVMWTARTVVSTLKSVTQAQFV